MTPTKGLAATQARVCVESPSLCCEELVDTGAPAQDLDDQGKRLRDKFRRLASPRLGSDSAEALADAAGSLDDGDSLDTVLRLVFAAERS